MCLGGSFKRNVFNMDMDMADYTSYTSLRYYNALSTTVFTTSNVPQTVKMIHGLRFALPMLPWPIAQVSTMTR
jgi:hypothetical protein